MSEMFGNLFGDEDKKSKPTLNFNFGLEIDGIIESSFMRASGVASEIEVFPYSEGGVNEYEHQIPTKTKYSNIVLEKGVTKSDELYKWFNQIQSGIIDRRDFSIILWNNKFEIIRRWNFSKGYPVKWSISDFDALGNTTSIEKIELTHTGITI